jgi:hypothetical protein
MVRTHQSKEYWPTIDWLVLPILFGGDILFVSPKKITVGYVQDMFNRERFEVMLWGYLNL